MCPLLAEMLNHIGTKIMKVIVVVVVVVEKEIGQGWKKNFGFYCLLIVMKNFRPVSKFIPICKLC